MCKTLLFVFSLVSVALGSTARSADSPEVTLTERVWSEYVNVVGKQLHDGPVLTSNLDLSFGNGWGLTIWSSVGLNDADLSSDKGDEIDLTLSYKDQLGNGRYLIAGGIYADLVDLLSAEGDNVRPFVELGQEWTTGKHKITVYSRVEYKISIEGSDHGAWVFLGIKDGWRFNPTVLLKPRLCLVWDGTNHEGLLLMGNFDVSWRVGEKLTLDVLCLKGSTPLLKADDRRSELVGGVGLTHNF